MFHSGSQNIHHQAQAVSAVRSDIGYEIYSITFIGEVSPRSSHFFIEELVRTLVSDGGGSSVVGGGGGGVDGCGCGGDGVGVAGVVVVGDGGGVVGGGVVGGG